MKVKIGTEWHDSDLEPILLTLGEREKEQIRISTDLSFAIFPPMTPPEEIEAFLEEEDMIDDEG